MAVKVIVAPEVREDLKAAYVWYESRRIGLGEDFLVSVDACFQALSRMPEMYGTIHKHYRRAPTRRFPYAILYK